MNRKALLFVSILSLAGCSHSLMRGTVAMKVNDKEAHICMGDGEVKVGDKVTLFRNDCRPKGGCKKVDAGEGSVTQVLNEHYSAIQVTKGTFEEGTIVEKR